MLDRLRTYRLLPALLALALLASAALPLAQEVCAMQAQEHHPMPAHSDSTSDDAHEAAAQAMPMHAADRCCCNGENQGEPAQPPCHPTKAVSLEALCCEATPAGAEPWGLLPATPQPPDIAYALAAVALDVRADETRAHAHAPWQAPVDPPPSPPARLLFSVFLI